MALERCFCRTITAAQTQFFNKPEDYKMQISMKKSKVFRGFFPLGDELTSGRPGGSCAARATVQDKHLRLCADWKQGLYFERELDDTHHHVQAGTPMHGKNQFPPSADFPEFRHTVLEYMRCMTALGHTLMAAMARALDLPESFFEEYTQDPFTPFRIFHYPADPVGVDAADGKPRFGVQEHTDYGVLTILAVDDSGLEVKERGTDQWIKVPLIPETFVVNVGDMAELWTDGVFRATPHRVRNTSDRDRISLPFFFDPSWDAIVRPLLTNSQEGAGGAAVEPQTATESVARTPSDAQAAVDAYRAGQKGQSIQYGPYILSKVLKVFPQLANSATT